MSQYPRILHHGAVNGVTGSCHELCIDSNNSALVDCGMFQGAETSAGGAGENRLEIDFPITQVRALLATHVHIDHVGRIPYLLDAGFKGPIYCSEPSAMLLPLVLEDAFQIGVTREPRLVKKFLSRLRRQIVAVPYNKWVSVDTTGSSTLDVRYQKAGHILGSVYVEARVRNAGQSHITVFSGDLGAPHAPLLPAPKSPHGADTVVIESTYGDRLHESRKERRDKLQAALEHAFQDNGVVMIPAFSIGRTQELLYELEGIIHKLKNQTVARKLKWKNLPIIVDSPLASRFTSVYRKLKPFWNDEARSLIRAGRHPLSFKQLITINSHADHLSLVHRLSKTNEPCVVIAASGMCSGGRIVNYLEALIEEPRNDIVFVGYQAKGSPGRDIQRYGSRNGHVNLHGKKYTINSQVTTLGGYSAHADQADLIRFVTRIKRKPSQVRIVHGDDKAKLVLQGKLQALMKDFGTEVVIPDQ